MKKNLYFCTPIITSLLKVAFATFFFNRQLVAAKMQDILFVVVNDVEMTELEFIQKLKDLCIDKQDLVNKNLSEEFIDEFIKGYHVKKKSNTVNVEDPLLSLIYNYELKYTTIGMITFNESIIESDKYFFVGKLEIDSLVISKITGEVNVIDSLDDKTILWKCAKDGSAFLNSLVVSIAFLNQCLLDGEIADEPKKACQKSKECSKEAGGDKYLGFYKMLLGCFE